MSESFREKCGYFTVQNRLNHPLNTLVLSHITTTIAMIVTPRGLQAGNKYHLTTVQDVESPKKWVQRTDSAAQQKTIGFRPQDKDLSTSEAAEAILTLVNVVIRT